jgi:hypothetical protein
MMSKLQAALAMSRAEKEKEKLAAEKRKDSLEKPAHVTPLQRFLNNVKACLVAVTYKGLKHKLLRKLVGGLCNHYCCFINFSTILLKQIFLSLLGVPI